MLEALAREQHGHADRAGARPLRWLSWLGLPGAHLHRLLARGPARHPGLAVVQLLVPLTLQRQRQLETLAEALRAWSALPVFVISIAIVMQQIEMVSGFMVGNPCHQLG